MRPSAKFRLICRIFDNATKYAPKNTLGSRGSIKPNTTIE